MEINALVDRLLQMSLWLEINEVMEASPIKIDDTSLTFYVSSIDKRHQNVWHGKCETYDDNLKKVKRSFEWTEGSLHINIF